MSNTVLFVVGARPNFVKVAPILRTLSEYSGLRHYLVHTGQHYDERLSSQFFHDLDIPEPDVNLEVGSAAHGQQTGEIMIRLEPVVANVRPCCTLVVGDVNSTLAAALVAAKLHIPIAHVEAGLRSFDRNMPEEINRVVTDVLSDVLFVTEAAGVENLLHEGIPGDRIHLVGDVMVDAAAQNLDRARRASLPLLQRLGSRPFGLLTLHRPSNVDNKNRLLRIVTELEKVCQVSPLVFPVHPRTARRLHDFGLMDRLDTIPGLTVLPPLGYLEFLGLLEKASFVATDSGGIQSEATYLQTPCLTLRTTTERPETVACGANRLLGDDPSTLVPAIRDLLDRAEPPPQPPKLMDAQASHRIARVLNDRFASAKG